MRPQSTTVERKVALIAGRQHGVVTHEQLLSIGVSPAGVQRRVRKGALIRVHLGVYRVGHSAPSTEASYLAAVLACGRGAVLSHNAAAHLYRLVKGPAPPAEITASTKHRIASVITHRGTRRATRHSNIPIVSVPQALVDVAADLPLSDLARACHEAGVLYRTTPRQVERLFEPNSRGARNLRSVMRGDTRVTLSKLEAVFIALLKEHGLPLPITNKPAGAHRVDCRWPQYKLTVELDSYRFHNSRYAWEQDRRRDRDARRRKDQLVRYTYGDITEDCDGVIAELRLLLA